MDPREKSCPTYDSELDLPESVEDSSGFEEPVLSRLL